jgi:hypothetical protein
LPKCSALRGEEHEAKLLQLAEDQKLLAQPVSTESSGKFDGWAARASTVFGGQLLLSMKSEKSLLLRLRIKLGCIGSLELKWVGGLALL